MTVNTHSLKKLLDFNRISVRDFGAEVFPEYPDMHKQEANASKLIHNRMQIKISHVRKISKMLSVQPSDFIIGRRQLQA